jgi:acyl-CoA thioesterase-1
MLLGIRIPPNYGKAYTDRFEQTYVEAAQRSGSPLLPFFVGDLVLDPAYMQEDMIHPNDAAQPLIRDRVVPFILDSLAQ